jgi:hypothetical protein
VPKRQKRIVDLNANPTSHRPHSCRLHLKRHARLQNIFGFEKKGDLKFFNRSRHDLKKTFNRSHHYFNNHNQNFCSFQIRIELPSTKESTATTAAAGKTAATSKSTPTLSKCCRFIKPKTFVNKTLDNLSAQENDHSESKIKVILHHLNLFDLVMINELNIVSTGLKNYVVVVKALLM